MKPLIKKISTYAAVGSLGAVIVVGLSGCEQRQGGDTFTQASQKVGAFVVIDEVAKGEYKIAEEYPGDQTRVILREMDGNERILTQREIDDMVAREGAKIDAGTSPLTNPELSSGGMSLGETILASAAGAIIGSWIGSKLFNNPTYQQNRQRSYKTPSAYTRSTNSFNKARALAGTKSTRTKSGFFGGTNKKTSGSRFGTFGG